MLDKYDFQYYLKSVLGRRGHAYYGHYCQLFSCASLSDRRIKQCDFEYEASDDNVVNCYRHVILGFLYHYH